MKKTRIAIGQLRMRWTIEENMAAITDAIRFSARKGAAICVFPELATTGFHRRIVEHAFPEKIQPQVDAIAKLCREHRVAVSVGAPTFDGEHRFNSQLLVDESGAVTAVPKIGLTEPEATFFRPGAHRPVARLQGLRTSAVLCREVEDHDSVRGQLEAHAVDLLVWPGQMRPDPDKPPCDPPEHVQHAQQLARALRCHVVQANWPNALNRPEESADTGHSAVIAPSGELLQRLPKATAGIGIVELGAKECEWFPEP